ncbi:MAG: hypothetical protein PHX14_05775 [Syntrophomonadaceae bacterium]|nr:hypothetical protein [Syntrophomonadaceae bacterium]
MKRISILSVLFTLLVLALSLTACTTEQEVKNNIPQQQKSNPNLPVPKLNDYFPLMASSSWEYEGIGNEYASFSREVLFAQENLVQIKESNGGTVSTSIFAISDDNIKRVFFAGETYHPENLLPDKFSPNDNTIILKSPLKLGTSWGEGENQREISSLDISTDTPAGKFAHCLQIKSSGQDSTVYEYYSQGTGLVKREFISGDAKIISHLKKSNIPR